MPQDVKRKPFQLSLFQFIVRAGRSLIGRKPVVKRRRRNQEQTRSLSSSPLLKKLWLELRTQWFPTRPDLDNYNVVWSRRSQKRTLASCSIEGRKVTVARELKYKEHAMWLKPLLYHEMCHAYLGPRVMKKDNKKQWHGKDFKLLERRFSETKSFNHWVNSGGWIKAVRSDRAKRAYARRATTQRACG
jgi:hypothetical protein